MSRRKSHKLRRWLLWSLPVLVLPVVVLCAFIVWCLSTPSGTRWALTTGAGFAGVQVEGVSGTVWRGVRVGRVRMDDPAMGLELDDLVLRADWRALTDRRLWVQELSAARVAVDLRPQEEVEEPDSGPFEMPELPVSLTLDKFALGAFELTQSGTPMLGAQDVLAALDVRRNGQGLLNLREGTVSYDTLKASLDGQVQLHEAGGVWPMSAELHAIATTADPAAPICISQYLPDLPKDEADEQGGDAACALTASLQAEGSLEALGLKGQAQGQGLKADVNLQLLPQAAFPLRSGEAQVTLADGARLQAKLDYQAGQGETLDQVVAAIELEKLDLQTVAGPAMPQARLTSKVDASAQLTPQGWPREVSLLAEVAPGSTWLGEPLRLSADAHVFFPPELQPQWWTGLHLERLNIDAQVARNHVRTQGALGRDDRRLSLDIDAAKLEQLWPGLPGGVRAKGWLTGDIAKHRIELDASYIIKEGAAPEALGEAPAQIQLALQGGWAVMPPVRQNAAETTAAPAEHNADTPPASTESGDDKAAKSAVTHEMQGWQGQLTKLAVQHAGLRVDTRSPVALTLRPDTEGAMHWRVGAFEAGVALPGLQAFTVAHKLSEGGPAGIHTQGDVPRLTLTRAALRRLQETWAPVETSERGRVILAHNPRLDDVQLVFGVHWDLRMAEALAGNFTVKRLEGDFIVPAEQPFPLGLTALDLAVQAQPAAGGASRVSATVTASSTSMGSARAVGNILLRRTAEGGWGIRESDPITFESKVDLHNLSWVSLFAGDALEVGGRLQADVTGRSLPGGRWDTRGTMSGEKLRIVRVDDGIRLLDGTLRGRFDGGRVILESLRFPAVLRVTPKEWRTDEWVRTNPEAQGGYLDLNGEWDINDFKGGVNIDLHRYPILQRSDRYAMISGELHINVPYPAVELSGKIDVDAGWIDLDMLSSVPTVDGDVVVVRKGQKQPENTAPMDVSMDLQVGLGPRFYITGYGVNSGLVGDLRLRMNEGKFTAQGVLRTRGGAISAYGQRLQLRQGTITFQGDITSPILNIEALRTGQAVQAGVRVAGTARRPRIDLVSYPEVSEVEKLSWLLLGRGPDESGSDAALLFSVGSSFLTDGEPFYKRFGLDEVTMRNGELGSSGSVLPPESVVRGFDAGTSDIERKFIVASKHLSENITASVEQALADTGTVGRLAYRLGRGLSAQLTVGTINGMALIYRGFSKD